MRKGIIILASVAIVLLSSCVHQWPEARPAQVDLTLVFNTDMQYHKTVLFPDETKSVSWMSLDDELFDVDLTGHERHDVRYVIEAYRALSNGSYSRDAVARWTFIDEDASRMDEYSCSVMIDEGKHLFRVWADYVEAGTSSDLHYLTSDWRSGIKLNQTDGYDGATDWRDAYVGSVELEVIRYGAIADPVSGVVDMKRPHGKYFILTNDLDEFASKVLHLKAKESDDETKAPQFQIDDYTFVITYTSFVPNSYNIHTDRANDSAPTATFESALTQVDDTRAIMGFDYVITGTQGNTSVRVGLQLRDKDGAVLAEHNNVNIPVNANQYTLVEGRFLMQESSGGVAIDPGFNGPDIVVPVN